MRGEEQQADPTSDRTQERVPDRGKPRSLGPRTTLADAAEAKLEDDLEYDLEGDLGDDLK